MIHPKHAEILYIQWGALTGEQWKEYSVSHIHKPSPKNYSDSVSDRMNTPLDPLLGEQKNRAKCETCGKFNTECTGHAGHIDLPFPIYNLRYANQILKLLQCICVKCARPRMKPSHIEIQGFYKLHGFSRLKALAEKCNKSVKTCPFEDCNEPMLYFSLPVKKKSETGIIYYTAECKKNSRREEFSAREAYDVFTRISFEDLQALGFNSDLLHHPEYTNPEYFVNERMQHAHQFLPEAMLYTTVPVLSPLSRPSIRDKDGVKEDDLTVKYDDLVKAIKVYNDFHDQASSVSTRRGHIKTKADLEFDIQNHLWTLANTKDEKNKTAFSGTKVHRSIICRLINKDGRIQQNVGGKRTNFSARSVIIGGGIRLKYDELGVPRHVAEVTTHPVRVGEWNLQECQQLVREGKVNNVTRMPDRPMEGNLPSQPITIRFAKFPDKGRSFLLKPGDVIGRHLQDGDFVLFNRQPTLSPEGMVGFKSKIVDGLCFMLNLVWTRGYNADFDGRVD